MAFTYNTSFHRTIGITPFKVTYSIGPRTPDFEPRQLYGEDRPTELYQRLQACHNMAKLKALNNTEKNKYKYTEGHDKKIKLRTFMEGRKYY
jgi:hypothetical protein